jgi:hypothetical protein
MDAMSDARSKNVINRALCIRHLLCCLEADVLECLCSRPVQLGCTFVIPATSSEVAARDPCGRAVAT